MTENTDKQNKSLHKIIENYILIRDARDKIMERAKQQCQPYDARLAKYEGKLLEVFGKLGVTNVSAAGGTAYISKATKASVADWDTFLEWVQKNDAWHMLEKRAAKSAVDEFREEQDDLPPGINYSEAMTIKVRRKSK